MANLINGLGGAAGFGEDSLFRNDDGSSSFINVLGVFEGGLNYFGVTYTGFYINNNGGITFAGPRSTFTPSSIVSATSNPEITPYYADIDTRGGATSASGVGTSTGSDLVYWDLDPANNTVTITWDDVGYFSRHIDKLNSFQLVLTDLSGSFGGSPGDFRIEFRYEDISWTTGDASNGTNGLGGVVARAGFSAGQGTPDSFFELPQSGNQEAMLALDTTAGNTGIAGLWRFDVTNGEVRPVVSVQSTTGAAREGTGDGQVFTFTVSRSGDSTQELTVGYVVTTTGGIAGADPDDLVGGLPLTGALRGGVVTFAPGQTVATIELQAVGDGTPEMNESFMVTLTSISDPVVSFGQRQATATILNDDGLGPDIPATWSIGRTFGDPHLTTMDGLQYDFQAVGEFIYAESTSGAPLTVQIRTEAVGTTVSATTALATSIDGIRITYDVHTNVLAINGVATVIDPSVGSVAVGSGHVFLSAEGVYQVAYPDNQTALLFADRGDFIDLNLALDPARAGQIHGLIGNFDGSTANDFALRDGTVLGSSLSFDTLYGSYANSWRISNAESLLDYGAGQSTETFTNLDHPQQQITLDQFPDAIVAAAIAQAAAAGITDPLQQQAAALDFLLTGNDAYLNAPILSSAPSTDATATGAPTASIVGVGATVFAREERDSGTTSFDVTFFRSEGTGTAEVSYAVQNIDTDAADFVDGVVPSGTVSFADGETQKTVSITVAGDTAAEYDEAFRVAVTGASGGAVIGAPSVDLTIINDDGTPPPKVAISGPAAVTEGTGGTTDITYTLTRTGDSSQESTVAVNLVPTAGAPVDGADFAGGALPGGTVVFAAGVVEQTFTVSVSADAGVEANETFELVVSPVGNALVVGGPAATTLVNDDLPPPDLALSGPGAVTEGTGGSTAVTYTVTRTGNLASASAVAYSVVPTGGSPVDAADFAAGALPSGVIQFAAGEAQKTFTVDLGADAGVEADETLAVVLGGASNGVVTSGVVGTTVVNDDTALAISGPSVAWEGSGGGTTQVSFLVWRTGNLSGSSAVSFSVVGTGGQPISASDFAGGVLPGGTVLFEAGQTQQTITLDFVADGINEASESYDVVLGTALGGVITGAAVSSVLLNDDTIDETYTGTGGPDSLFGADGNDQLFGFDGNDTLNGGTGKDTLVGGAGNDTYVVDSKFDKVVEGAKGGIDVVQSSVSFTLSANVEKLVLTGSGNLKGIGNGLANTITGNGGANVLKGGAGNDVLDGKSGNDKLYGDAGNDKLVGGLGNDSLFGGLGADKLYGGAGKDLFGYLNIKDSTVKASGQDTIFDFANGDRFDLRALDAVAGTKGNQAFDFIGTDAFSKIAGELRFETKKSDTFIYGDTNGDGKADFAIHLDDALILKQADFLL